MEAVSITYKNFCGCGNRPITIYLNKNPLTLIVGENGAGKSTFLDAIMFAIYGKSFRKTNKLELVNDMNKSECLVEFIFKSKGDTYKIYRGIKPNIFKIFKNDIKVLEDSDIKSQQAYVDQIIGIKYEACKQVVVLGASDYTPFMKLNSSERRKFIEDMLDMKVYTVMSDIAKADYRRIKANFDTVSNEMISTEREINYRLDNLSKMMKLKSESIQPVDTGLDDSIEKSLANISQLQETLSKYDKNKTAKLLSESLKKKRKMDGVSGQLNYNIKSKQKTIDFLTRNDVCPTCDQNIQPDFKKNKIDVLSTDIKKSEKNIQDCEVCDEAFVRDITSHESTLSEYSKLDNELRIAMNNHKSLVNIKSPEVVDTSSHDKLINEERDNITKLNEKLIIQRTTRNELHLDVERHMKIIDMLKDGGIKSEVVKVYVPLINQYMDKYLSMLNFNGEFRLDENFKETIKRRKRDPSSYNKFSQGERKRIDLALMMTWRDMSNNVNKSNPLSLLVLDEVFDSSLDASGVEAFMEIIEKMEDQNVFIISHRSDNMLEHFSKVIKFQKNNGFSEIVLDS